jgi:colanic acid/amylovoran biosynthesis glycosyltransferase
MRIVYVTSTLPYGSREAFLIPEIAALAAEGHKLTLVPMRPKGEIVHDDIRPFLEATLASPLFSRAIFVGAVAEAVSFPLRTIRALRYVLRSRSLRILGKNISVFAKGVWLSRQARRLEAEHLHAHWASTSSTMALVAGEISGIPWSFTAHRWDIAENNLLERKGAKACFVRAISRKGAGQLASYLATPTRKLLVLHVGIDIPAATLVSRSGTSLRVLTPADLVEVKGHRHLLEAIRAVESRGVAVLLDLAGEGPLRAEVERQIAEAGLGGRVTLLGTVPHARLLHDLLARRWDAVVLPSVATPEAEEGIPVSLIEAMGAGLPVLSTRTGAIPELLDAGAGLLVAAGDPVALADGLETLARDPDLRKRLADRGRRRALSEFNVRAVASALAQRFEECSTRESLVGASETGTPDGA